MCGASGISGVKGTSNNAEFALAQRAGQPVDNFTVKFDVATTAVLLDREKLEQDACAFDDVSSAPDRRQVVGRDPLREPR